MTKDLHLHQNGSQIFLAFGPAEKTKMTKRNPFLQRFGFLFLLQNQRTNAYIHNRQNIFIASVQLR